MKQFDNNSPEVIALNKAKIALMAKPDVTFYTTVLFSFRQIWDDSIPTLATNGKCVKINPQFFMGLDPELRVSGLVHEAMHPAYMHVGKDRMGDRDPELWNCAGDYIINGQLKRRGFKIGENWLYDAKYDDPKWTTEMVYDDLKAQGGKQKPQWKDLQEPEGDPEQVRNDIQDILVRAAIQSKMAGDKPGSIPGEIEVYLDKLLNPKLPWTTILRKYLQSFNKNDYTFKRPNKRFFPQHYLPGLWSESLMELAVSVDISSSVSDDEFLQFVGDTASVLKMMKPPKIDFIQFNTQITSIDSVKSVEELKRIKFVGRGGTDIKEICEWATKTQAKVMIVFSDGFFSWPVKEHKTDFIWIIHNNPSFVAPFGKVIHYEI